MGVGRDRRKDYKEAEEKFENDDYLYVDFGDNVYICQNLPDCTLENKCVLFQLNLSKAVKNFSSFYSLKIPLKKLVYLLGRVWVNFLLKFLQEGKLTNFYSLLSMLE